MNHLEQLKAMLDQIPEKKPIYTVDKTSVGETRLTVLPGAGNCKFFFDGTGNLVDMMLQYGSLSVGASCLYQAADSDCTECGGSATGTAPLNLWALGMLCDSGVTLEIARDEVTRCISKDAAQYRIGEYQDLATKLRNHLDSYGYYAVYCEECLELLMIRRISNSECDTFVSQ